MMFENSRYLRTPIYNILGETHPMLKIRKRFSFNKEKCQLHEWVEGDTLDGVSYRYYEISALRWAILDANPQYRTEFDIQYGDNILIPDFDEILEIVNV